MSRSDCSALHGVNPNKKKANKMLVDLERQHDKLCAAFRQ